MGDAVVADEGQQENRWERALPLKEALDQAAASDRRRLLQGNLISALLALPRSLIRLEAPILLGFRVTRTDRQ